MQSANSELTLKRIVDRAEIYDAMCRYARGVDRGDWELMRSAYHSDAYDEHGDYKGGIDGLIEWLDKRFAGVDNSTHFLGNCLIEFSGPDQALVETYFVSRRLRPPTADENQIAGPQDQMCREGWGRYVDVFERRDGQWRVAHRTVVLEAMSTSLAIGGVRNPSLRWGNRDQTDLIFQTQKQLSDA